MEFKIQIPEGHEIDKEKSTFEKIVFRKTVLKDICDIIQNMADVYRLNNTSKEDFYKKWEGFAIHEIGNAKEVLIVKAYNQGWVADWSNSSEYKYFPWFSMENFSYFSYRTWASYSTTSARLCFREKRLLLDAVSKFLPEYKESRL